MPSIVRTYVYMYTDASGIATSLSICILVYVRRARRLIIKASDRAYKIDKIIHFAKLKLRVHGGRTSTST
jgi:hypothetical protein